jgi:hypothetical protein
MLVSLRSKDEFNGNYKEIMNSVIVGVNIFTWHAFSIFSITSGRRQKNRGRNFFLTPCFN